MAAFLYPGGPLDTVLRVGGQKEFFATCEEEILLPPSASAESCPAGLAANDPGWNWSALPSMASPRAYPNAVLLPDASVLAVTGNGDESLLTTPLPVLQAEVLNDDPSAPHTWRSVASMAVRRGYHGTTLLLPDGRVLGGAGEQREHDYEIFSGRTTSRTARSGPSSSARRTRSRCSTARPTSSPTSACAARPSSARC